MGAAPIAGLLGALFGYGVGQSPQEWQELEERVNERLGHLRYVEVDMPLAFYDEVHNAEALHAEAIGTYLLGYQNASIPMSFRCLEVALSERYEDLEGEEPDNMSSYNLLEYFDEEGLFDESPLTLQWFRKQRNKIHTTGLVEEADALEAIRHTTRGINDLYPYDAGFASGELNCCGNAYELELERDSFYLGNTIDIECDSCYQKTPHQMLPRELSGAL